MIATIAHSASVVVALFCALLLGLWLISELGLHLQWVRCERTRDGRMLATFLVGGEQRMALGNADRWIEVYCRPGEAIYVIGEFEDPKIPAYLHQHWAVEEQLRRRDEDGRRKRAERLARRARRDRRIAAAVVGPLDDEQSNDREVVIYG